MQLPARDLGHGQLVVSGQLDQWLALTWYDQSRFGFKLDLKATADAFWGHYQAKLVPLKCPGSEEYY